MKKLIVLVLVFFTLKSFAQSSEQMVTLVANGSGKTQEDARMSAFRSAVEQAYGVFISSKTEINTDSLVKDQISALTTGNIQNYKIIAETHILNNYSSTIQATVSLTKLNNFVRNKGMISYFNGNSLAINIKLQILNEKAEEKAIKNISTICKSILDKSVDFEVTTGEPKQYNSDNNKWEIPVYVNAKFNKNIDQFTDFLTKSLSSVAMSAMEVKTYQQLGKQSFLIALGPPPYTGCLCGRFNAYDNALGKTIAKAPLSPEMRYHIYDKDHTYTTRSLDSINIELRRMKKNMNLSVALIYNTISLVYSSKYCVSPNLVLRRSESIKEIIDLIYYIKKILLNFKVGNEIRTFVGLDLDKKELLSISEHRLDPILFSGENLVRHQTQHDFFWKNPYIGGRLVDSWGSSTERFSLPSNYAVRGGFDGRGYKFEDYEKGQFSFLYNQGFQAFDPLNSQIFNAIISLSDFDSNLKSIVKFQYPTIYTLAELNKISKHQISAN